MRCIIFFSLISLLFISPFLILFTIYQCVMEHYAEHVEIDEAKSVFEANYSHVYFILYDTFVQAETNLRQRGKFAAIQFG